MGSLQICSVGVTLSVLKFLVVCYPIFCPLNLPTNLENIMGGCAGKPRDSDLDKAPAPVEAPTASENTGVETVHQLQEKKDGETKEEPLLDLSEPAPEAVKNDEVIPATEIKLVLEELVPVKIKPEEAEKPAEAVDVVKEEEKEVADIVAAPEKPKA